MARALILALCALAASCASTPAAAPLQARIASDVLLTLPLPPGYPDTRVIQQIGQGRYGEHESAFEAVLSLAPARVEIVLTMLGGPRLATITWDEAGIREARSPFAPDEVPVQNILADVFVSMWPAEAVAHALPEGVRLSVEEDGARTVSRGDEVLVSVIPDAENPARSVVRNALFGYEVIIVNQRLE